jgi:hypothetical protein
MYCVNVSRYRKFLHFREPEEDPNICPTEATQDIKTTEKYSNIYPTGCNVTQFILSGNCSQCFVWRTPPTAHSNQFQLFHDSGR